MMYFDTPAFLSQSPQLYKQLAILGGMERVRDTVLPSEQKITTHIVT